MKAEHIAISERIAKHLETQMAQSWHPQYGCAYRSPEGLSCAVGCLMTDEAYAEARKATKVEGATAASELVEDILEASGVEVDTNMVRVLMYWQQYHDGMSGGPKYTDWLADPDNFPSPTEFHQRLLS